MQGVACSTCVRFRADVRDKDVCDAFPGGIPTEVLTGANPHREPIEGDGGMTWSPVPGFEDA